MSAIYQETSFEEEGGEPALKSSSAYMSLKTQGRSSQFSQALSAFVILGLFRVRDVISECLQSRGEMRKAFSRLAFLLNETYNRKLEGGNRQLRCWKAKQSFILGNVQMLE